MFHHLPIQHNSGWQRGSHRHATVKVNSLSLRIIPWCTNCVDRTEGILRICSKANVAVRQRGCGVSSTAVCIVLKDYPCYATPMWSDHPSPATNFGGMDTGYMLNYPGYATTLLTHPTTVWLWQKVNHLQLWAAASISVADLGVPAYPEFQCKMWTWTNIQLASNWQTNTSCIEPLWPPGRWDGRIKERSAVSSRLRTSHILCEMHSLSLKVPEGMRWSYWAAVWHDRAYCCVVNEVASTV